MLFRQHQPEIPSDAIENAIVEATARAGIYLAKKAERQNHDAAERRRHTKMDRYDSYHPQTVVELMARAQQNGDTAREGTFDEMIADVARDNPDAAQMLRVLDAQMRESGFKPRYFNITPPPDAAN